MKEKQYTGTCKSLLVWGLTESRKDRKTKKSGKGQADRQHTCTSMLTWKSCDGRIIAVSLNHVICGLGFPSTWHSNCTVVPSGACLGCNFCTKRGADACSPGVSSAEIIKQKIQQTYIHVVPKPSVKSAQLLIQNWTTDCCK